MHFRNRFDTHVSSNIELLVISSHSIICPPPWRNGTNMNPIHIGDLGTIFVPSFSIADTSFTSVNDAMKHALSRSALWMWTINNPMRSEFMERILSCRITFRMSVLIANPYVVADGLVVRTCVACSQQVSPSWTLKLPIADDLLPRLGTVLKL